MLTSTICPIYIKMLPYSFFFLTDASYYFHQKRKKKNPSEFSFPQRKSDYFTTFLFLRAKTTIRATAANRVITSGITFVVSPVLTPASADLLELLSSDFVVCLGASLVLVSLSVTLVSRLAGRCLVYSYSAGLGCKAARLSYRCSARLGCRLSTRLGCRLDVGLVAGCPGPVAGVELGSVVGSLVPGSVAGVELGSVVGSVLGSVAGVVLGSVVGSVLGSVVGSVTGASVSTASKIASIERYPSLDPFS